MSQFLLNFIINNIFIIIAFCIIFFVIALISKPFRKVILIGFTLCCVYLGLVALYKMGVGNDTLYQWSLKVIYSNCILFERFINFVFISEGFLSKFITLLMKYGYDGFTIFKDYSEYVILYVLPYIKDKKKIYTANDYIDLEISTVFEIENRKRIKNNIQVLSTVLRC